MSVAVETDSPPELLGAAVFGRENAGDRLRRGRGSFADHFGDSEIEELRNTIGGDQDVVGFQIPMDDQLLMGELNGVAYRQHQLDSLARGEFALVAEPVDGLAGYVLHHKVRQAIAGGARIREPGDVGMLQARQDAALLLQAAGEGPAESCLNDLDG